MFNPSRLKVQLKLSISRLKMLQSKKTSLNQQHRREIATLLEKDKESSARVRVEHIIRDDMVIEAMEGLELYCDLLLARFGLIEQYKTCESSIEEAVNTIIWSAPRVGEVKELSLVRDQLAVKYGKEFMMQALENQDERVDPKIVIKLDISIPDPFLVERYLEEIARAYKIPWTSDILKQEEEEQEEQDDDEEDEDDFGGGDKEEDIEALISLDDNNNIPATENNDFDFDLPEIPSNTPLNKPSAPKKNDDGDDFDDLAKRLAALKKK